MIRYVNIQTYKELINQMIYLHNRKLILIDISQKKKKCSPALIIRKIKNKTAMRYSLIPFGMTVIKRHKIINAIKDARTKEIFPHSW